MTAAIRKADLSALLRGAARTVRGQPVLPNEIDDLDTLLHAVSPGDIFELPVVPGQARVLLFAAGTGVVHSGAARFDVEEISLLAPRPDHSLRVEGGEQRLEILEMRLGLNNDDVTELQAHPDRLPYFAPYSRCRTYRERIKSPRTISRTLLPQDTFPRLCVGSVQTTGDDHVATHAHPMLEQLFYGLQGNRCVVRADAATVDFGEHELLHIPLGSSHSVDVAAPHALHYVWIDRFRDPSGMDWIRQEHQEE